MYQEAQVVVSPVLAEVQRLRQEASVLRDKASCCSGAKARQLRSMAEMKEHRAEALLLPPSLPDRQEESVRGGAGLEAKKEVDNGIEPSHRYMEAPYSRDLFLESGERTGGDERSSLRTYKRESEGANTDSFSSLPPSSSCERPGDRDRKSCYNEPAVGSAVSGLRDPASPKGGRGTSVEERNIPLGERVTSRTGGCTDTASREPDGLCSDSLDDDENSVSLVDVLFLVKAFFYRNSTCVISSSLYLDWSLYHSVVCAPQACLKEAHVARRGCCSTSEDAGLYVGRRKHSSNTSEKTHRDVL